VCILAKRIATGISKLIQSKVQMFHRLECNQIHAPTNTHTLLSSGLAQEFVLINWRFDDGEIGLDDGEIGLNLNATIRTKQFIRRVQQNL
jgi:hypothetical protein